MRAPIVRIIDRGDETTVIGAISRRFDGESAQLLRAVLALHARPATRAEVIAGLAALSDDGVVPEGPVDQLINLLEHDGVLVAPRPHVRVPATRRVVLCVTGAVAAADAPLLVRGLQGLGCIVRVAMTRTAQRFASAPALARIAHADCSDLVSAIATATRAPIAIAPSMNDAMYGSPAVQANLETLRAHGRYLIYPAMGVEVAHRPDERTPMFGPAPPAPVITEIVRYLLALTPPTLPIDAAGWERVWATTPLAQLRWHTEEIDPAIAELLDGRGGRLLDLGTGAGTIAREAARRGFAVTASDVAPSALGHARGRAGELPILFALDDVLRSQLPGPFETIVDCGLLHCLPRAARLAYAAQIERWRGALIVVAHDPQAPRAGAGHPELGTHPVTVDELARLFPARAIRGVPTTLSGRAAHAFLVAGAGTEV